ncbi:hypothetical protein P170DRAFT_82841 [Aspergillus steynii IBT 23096]|uniref:Uncharacterized protein n=1 Tax=Aspergillus steynii IBT 23096 TaxID=1392250 RepID=A0A2I2GFN0_9EURO|nr:uncharacterized protein P170DRAFT_82841 [Aspergillus steynii IBT 23096]PLB51679.1 hypothetical protein P170DRAFT_82841 [Aspergillus steynii IBT 23096]
MATWINKRMHLYSHSAKQQSRYEKIAPKKRKKPPSTSRQDKPRLVTTPARYSIPQTSLHSSERKKVKKRPQSSSPVITRTDSPPEAPSLSNLTDPRTQSIAPNGPVPKDKQHRSDVWFDGSRDEKDKQPRKKQVVESMAKTRTNDRQGRSVDKNDRQQEEQKRRVQKK